MEASPAPSAWPETVAAGRGVPAAVAVPPSPPAPGAQAALIGARADSSPASREPDEAVRWRLNAAIADGAIQFVAVTVIAFFAAAQGIAIDLWSAVALGVLGSWLYHFAFESHGGQTPGKKRFGVKVVRLDGGRAEPWRIAVRNILRGVDEFGPLSASGLITMWLSGATRRQRIGDKAAGTIVVPVDGRGRRGPSPRWLLPALASLAILVGIAEVNRAVHAPAPNRPAPSAPLPGTGPAPVPAR